MSGQSDVLDARLLGEPAFYYNGEQLQVPRGRPLAPALLFGSHQGAPRAKRLLTAALGR